MSAVCSLMSLYMFAGRADSCSIDDVAIIPRLHDSTIELTPELMCETTEMASGRCYGSHAAFTWGCGLSFMPRWLLDANGCVHVVHDFPRVPFEGSMGCVHLPATVFFSAFECKRASSS